MYTHAHAQCSHASVGLAQAHPNKMVLLTLMNIKSKKPERGLTTFPLFYVMPSKIHLFTGEARC